MVLSMERWVGKVAVVTGASTGIGAEIARVLVKNGIKVAGLARQQDRTQALAAKLSKEKGQLLAVKCDITKEEEILKAFEYVKEKLGPVSILINNAGIGVNTNLINGNTEMWKAVLDTNVLGLCIATREAIKQMKGSGIEGHVIHINSVGGHKVFPFANSNIYCASKFAVTALAESLRHEINRGMLKIKITSLSPGAVKSEFRDRAYGSAKPTGLLDIPELDAEDVADGVIYALSTPPHVNVTELTIQIIGESV